GSASTPSGSRPCAAACNSGRFHRMPPLRPAAAGLGRTIRFLYHSADLSASRPGSVANGYDARLRGKARLPQMRTLGCVLLLGLGAVAAAENAAAPRDSAEDELVVSGQRPKNLRVEIERLENSVYERFNALNSNDEFDIHCFERAPTGSNIPVRTCAPNFVIEAEAAAARKIVQNARARGSNNFDRAEHEKLMEQKSRELVEELQRVAREDE